MLTLLLLRCVFLAGSLSVAWVSVGTLLRMGVTLEPRLLSGSVNSCAFKSVIPRSSNSLALMAIYSRCAVVSSILYMCFMATEEKIRDLFLSLGRTKKVEFISDNIDYASDRAIVRHVGNYICDILEDLYEDGNIDGVVEFLKGKGYRVEKA